MIPSTNMHPIKRHRVKRIGAVIKIWQSTIKALS